jgi:hypothetical protein
LKEKNKGRILLSSPPETKSAVVTTKFYMVTKLKLSQPRTTACFHQKLNKTNSSMKPNRAEECFGE